MRFYMIEVAGRKVNINVREFNVRMCCLIIITANTLYSASA